METHGETVGEVFKKQKRKKKSLMTITEPNDNCWERGDGDTQQASWLHAESSTLTDLIGYMAFNQDYIYKYLKHILRRYRSEA